MENVSEMIEKMIGRKARRNAKPIRLDVEDLRKMFRSDPETVEGIFKRSQVLSGLFLCGCHDGDLEEVKNVVERGADINSSNTEGWTGLMIAASKGFENVATFLVEAGAELNVKSRRGSTALWLAATNGNFPIASLLLSAGSLVDAKDSLGRTPLMCSVYSGDFKMAQLLLTYGANPNVTRRDSGQYGERVFLTRPLFHAASTGDTMLVRLLLSHGAGVNAYECDLTALHVACSCGHKQVVKALLDANANVNALCDQGTSPLAWAISRGHLELADFMLRKGADITLGTQGCLGEACLTGNEAVLKWFLSRGGDPNTQTAPVGFSLLSAAAEKGNLGVMEELFRAGADLNFPSDQPPIITASHYGHLDAVRMLLEVGANVHAAGPHGHTALDHAEARGHCEIIDLLRSVGASSHYDRIRKERQAVEEFLQAVQAGDLEAMGNFLSAGMDPNLSNGDLTPLSIAAQNGRLVALELLLEQGADPNMMNHGGWTALRWAAENGDIETVQILLIAGATVSTESLLAAVSNNHRLVVELFLAEDSLERSSLDKALLLACRKGYREMVGLLLSSGAKVNARSRKKLTPLHLACHFGHSAIVEDLLSAGARLDSREKVFNLSPISLSDGSI